MSPIVMLTFGAIGVILILIGLTITKQIIERKWNRSSEPKRYRSSLGKDLSEDEL